MRFNWQTRSGTQVAHLDIRHNVTADVVAAVLVHTYGRNIEELSELPDNLTKAQVEEAVRKKLFYLGDQWMECAVWDEVPSELEDGIGAWAGATVRRLFPKAAASDPQFNKGFPEVSA